MIIQFNCLLLDGNKVGFPLFVCVCVLCFFVLSSFLYFPKYIPFLLLPINAVYFSV